MASSFNAKAVHKDGKSELKIGVDENAKILNGIGDEILIKNADGSPAMISIYNVPYIPENASKDNKLVTQEDLKIMAEKLNSAMKNIEEGMASLTELAKIVGLE